MKPVLGITLGEPQGIGPEVLAKALNIEEVFMLCTPVVFGVAEALQKNLAQFCLGRTLQMITPDQIQSGDFGSGKIAFCEPSASSAEEKTLKSIESCAKLCMDQVLDAMVTGPVDKFRLNQDQQQRGKGRFIGHTEFLAELAGVDRVAMMLAGEKLRVVPVTTHCPLTEVADQLSIKKISDTIELTALGLKEYYRIGEPKISVTALNPHAGEGGLLGEEEEKLILPAVEKSRLNGLDVRGPLSADTLFYQAVFQGNCDAVVTMYHDQALIPLKLLHFRDAINITLGLPFIRTSVDHGTAYDLVGKNMADPSSMVEAIRLAAHLSHSS